MRSVKNGKLYEDIPARSFCRSAQHALPPVQTRQRVRPPGTSRHGSMVTCVNPDTCKTCHNTCLAAQAARLATQDLTKPEKTWSAVSTTCPAVPVTGRSNNHTFFLHGSGCGNFNERCPVGGSETTGQYNDQRIICQFFFIQQPADGQFQGFHGSGIHGNIIS